MRILGRMMEFIRELIGESGRINFTEQTDILENSTGRYA